MALVLSGVGASPGEGLLVLEIQEKILKFLLDCATKILHDLPLTAPLSVSVSLSPPSFVIPDDVNWPSVAASVATAPYRVPAQFDFSRIKALVNAKLAEAEDHIWSLREDPAYFRDFAWDWSQHQPENLSSINGKRHPYLGKPRFWDMVFRNIIEDAYGNLSMWSLTQKQLIEIAALRDHYGPQISTSLELPVDYQIATDHFFYLVRRIRKKSLVYFSSCIFASPPLRQYYIRDPFQEANLTPIKVIRKDPSQEDYFLWLIERLSDESQLEFYGLAELLDELERVTRNTAGTSRDQRISAWVARLLSDLAVLTELGVQLKYHDPPIVRYSKEEDLKAEIAKRTILVDLIYDTCDEIQLWDLGTPLEKFRYPSEKRRTAVTTERMRTAERDLDAFWHRVDEHYKCKTGKTLQELVSDVLPSRELERTPEWIEPVPPSRSHRSVSPDTITDDFSKFNLGRESGRDSRTNKDQSQNSGTGCQEVVVDAPVPQIVPAPTIAVSKRAYKVFSALFYNPMKDPPPGEIPWSEFLHALSSIGFAVEKQYGSAWLFTPPDTHQRTIIFHEPHPSRNIPILIVRRHGRRLERAYNWTSETFVLAR